MLTMGELVGLPVRDWIGHRAASYIEFVLATPIILWAAWPFFRRGWDSVMNRSPNMWTLISLGVAAAYLYLSSRRSIAVLTIASARSWEHRTFSLAQERMGVPGSRGRADR